MAAVTHPRFKLSWVDDADVRARCTQQLESAVAASVQLSNATENIEEDGQSSTHDVAAEDFF